MGIHISSAPPRVDQGETVAGGFEDRPKARLRLAKLRCDEPDGAADGNEQQEIDQVGRVCDGRRRERWHPEERGGGRTQRHGQDRRAAPSPPGARHHRWVEGDKDERGRVAQQQTQRYRRGGERHGQTVMTNSLGGSRAMHGFSRVDRATGVALLYRSSGRQSHRGLPYLGLQRHTFTEGFAAPERSEWQRPSAEFQARAAAVRTSSQARHFPPRPGTSIAKPGRSGDLRGAKRSLLRSRRGHQACGFTERDGCSTRS